MRRVFPAPLEANTPGAAWDYFSDESGERHEFDYRAWFAGEPRTPRYDLAALEVAGALGAGTAYYWLRPGPNRQDWDFPDAWTRIVQVPIAFDTNLHRTNHVRLESVLAGYYAQDFARSSSSGSTSGRSRATGRCRRFANGSTT